MKRIVIAGVLALVAGGVGNNAGAVLGAVLIVVLLEGTRFVAPFLPFLGPAQIAAVVHYC